MPKEEPSEKAMDEQDQAEEQQPPSANDVSIEPSDGEAQQQQLPMHTSPSTDAAFIPTELTAEEVSSTPSITHSLV